MLFGKGERDNRSRVRIGINAHLLSGELSYRRAGIHNYMAQVLNHLPLVADDCTYSIFSRHATALSSRPGFEIHRSHWPTERRLARILWEQIAWPVMASRQDLDLVHGMAFATPLLTRKPSVVTVFDLSFIYFPERYPRLQRQYLRVQTARSCANARRVITISASGKQDVHSYFDIPLEQIDVVVPGVDPIYRPLPPEQVQDFRTLKGIQEQIILHVGTLQPRKNISQLLEAMVMLDVGDCQLVLVGGKGWYYDEIFARVVDLGLENRIRFTGYVPDAELPLWYNAASMLVFPSVYEGFGLPIVEAMACGTPVVAANSSSIPEAGGPAALYYKPDDVDEMVEYMTLILEDIEKAADLREKGLEHAQQFSWQRAGQDTAEVYKKALRLK